MKKKLTITIDAELLPRAKRYARARGVSLSSFIERSLRELTEEDVAYSKSLEQRNPAVAKFLSQIQLDPAVVNDWILKVGRDKEDPQDVAEAWVAANMDSVNGWID